MNLSSMPPPSPVTRPPAPAPAPASPRTRRSRSVSSSSGPRHAWQRIVSSPYLAILAALAGFALGLGGRFLTDVTNRYFLSFLSVMMICVLVCVSFAATSVEESTVQDDHSISSRRPIIGILSMEPSPKIRQVCGDHDSYIAASYVKYVEGAGARVVPILIGQTPEYYRKIVSSVNGLLFPGGATFFDEMNGYAAAGRLLYKLAKEANEKGGQYFPVLGICLGMELLAVEDAGGKDIRRKCTSEDNLPLKFMPGALKESRLFANATSAVVHSLERENVTANHHRLCITRDDMERNGLNRDWRVLSVNDDSNGLEFVSVLEHRRLPFYALQFHPEKNSYEWKPSKNHPHSASAIAVARHFSDFFVSEARQNNQNFAADEERSYLIYRHSPVDTKGRLMWEQLYFFQNHDLDSSKTEMPSAQQHRTHQVKNQRLSEQITDFDV